MKIKQQGFKPRIIAFLLVFAMIFSCFGGFTVQAAGGTGKIVISFEVYNPDDNMVALLTTKPEVVEFGANDTGMTLIKKVLGENNVDESGWIKSLTFDGGLRVGEKYEHFEMSNSSWSLYLNNAEANVGAGEYKPADGDVYRVIFTSYDPVTYNFPIMENDMDALYWAVAEAPADNVESEEALALIQSAPVQSAVEAEAAVLSASGNSHRICTDGRTIQINRSTVPYTATPTLAADKTSASPGETVAVTVNPVTGKQLIPGSLTANGVRLAPKEGSLNQYTFTMPDAHVVLTAQYEERDPNAGKLMELWFALDNKGDAKVPLTPEFSADRTDGYRITFYDSQLTKTSTNFYIWTKLSQGTSAKLRYSMGKSSGMEGVFDGPVLTSKTASVVKRSTVFSFGNGLDHYIRVTSSAGDMLDYTINMSLLPVLKNLKITDGNDAVKWDKPFSSTDFNYQIEVPDNADSITLAPELQTTSNTVKLNGTTVSAITSAALDSSGTTKLNLTVETKDAKELCTTYTITVKQPKAMTLKWHTVEDLSKNIAGAYIDKSEEWKVMDLAAYGRLNPETKLITSDIAQQNFINKAASESDSSDATAGTLSKYIITLKSIGIDASKLYMPNGSTLRNINASDKLRTKNVTAIFDAPWVLIANQQGNLNLNKQQIRGLVKIIKDNQGSGLFRYNLNGQMSDSPDTTGAVLSALAPYYLASGDEFGVKADVQEIVDKAVSALRAKQLSTGSLGSANTDAFVILGLTAVGIDPDQDFVKGGNSLVDGLLSYALPDKSGFGFTSNDLENELATEQGFRSLIAAAAYKNTNKAFNIYDYSANPSNPGRATGKGEVTDPTPPVSDRKIAVSFTLQGLDSAGSKQTWISGKSLSIPEGSTAAYAIMEALKGTGYKQVGAESGYIRSITTPKGYKLSERQGDWPNSGWLYSVNSTYPDQGICNYILKDNDRIVLRFTKDYTKEPLPEHFGGGSAEQPKPDDAAVIKPVVTVVGGSASASVSQKDITSALNTAKEKKSGSVAVSVESEKSFSSVNLTLASSGMKDLAGNPGMALNISSPVGTVTLPNGTLNVIASQAGTSDVQISMNVKSPSDIKLNGVDMTGACIVEVIVKAGNAAIIKFDGNSLLVSIPVSDSCKEGESYKVVVLSGDGHAETYAGTVVMKNKKPQVDISINHLSTFIVTKEKLPVYIDVPQNSWHYGSVQYAVLNNLMSGTGENKFSPDEKMTRAMLVTVLYRLEKSPAIDAASNFTDAKNGQWYTDAVIWANQNGIVAGYGNGLFGTKDSITRQQMAAILYRYALYKGYDVSKKGDLSDYSDADKVQTWALDGMKWANSGGMITGTDKTSLSPNSAATRAQAATILMRFTKK